MEGGRRERSGKPANPGKENVFPTEVLKLEVIYKMLLLVFGTARGGRSDYRELRGMREFPKACHEKESRNRIPKKWGRMNVPKRDGRRWYLVKCREDTGTEWLEGWAKGRCRGKKSL